MQGILETTRETGYTIVLCTHDNAPEKEEQALRTLRRQRIKGLLITPAAGYVENEDNSYLRASLRALDVPTVLIDRAVKMPVWDGVYYDNYNGVKCPSVGLSAAVLPKRCFSATALWPRALSRPAWKRACGWARMCTA